MNINLPYISLDHYISLNTYVAYVSHDQVRVPPSSQCQANVDGHLCRAMTYKHYHTYPPNKHTARWPNDGLMFNIKTTLGHNLVIINIQQTRDDQLMIAQRCAQRLPLYILCRPWLCQHRPNVCISLGHKTNRNGILNNRLYVCN